MVQSLEIAEVFILVYKKKWKLTLLCSIFCQPCVTLHTDTVRWTYTALDWAILSCIWSWMFKGASYLWL